MIVLALCTSMVFVPLFVTILLLVPSGGPRLHEVDGVGACPRPRRGERRGNAKRGPTRPPEGGTGGRRAAKSSCVYFYIVRCNSSRAGSHAACRAAAAPARISN